MTAVRITDAIKFGFVITGYLIAIFVVGAIILAIGFAVAVAGAGGSIGGIAGGIIGLIGLIILIIGSFVLYGALFGASYKIVADGVEQGIESAGGLTSGQSADTDEWT
jgi:hypothetical protein